MFPKHSQHPMDQSSPSMMFSYARSADNRVRPALIPAPSSKTKTVDSGDDPSSDHEPQNTHHGHSPTMIIPSHSFRPHGTHKYPAVVPSKGSDDIIIIPTRSQSIPWTTTTPTHSSTRKPLSGSFIFPSTPPPTNPRPIHLPRASTERIVFSSSKRKQKPAFVASPTATPQYEKPTGHTSPRLMMPKYISNGLPYHRTPRLVTALAAFSNTRSALSLSMILPLLLFYSDMITRIQLRSTCHLYRLAFHAYMRSRMELEDVRFDPLAADPSRMVHVRDWQAKFPTGAPKVWMNLRLVEVWRDVEKAELQVPLIREERASFFFFARLPCVPKDEWTVEKYLAGLEKQTRVRLRRHERRTRTGIDHEVFGRVEKETWHRVKGPAWYTVEDLARILNQRYETWTRKRHRYSLKDGGDHTEEGWKRTVGLRWDKSLEGYVFDASRMEGWNYP